MVGCGQVEGVDQLVHRRLAAGDAGQDGAAGRVGEGAEQAVQGVVVAAALCIALSI